MTRQSLLIKRYDKLSTKVIEALKKRHFDAFYCKTKDEAVQQILDLIPENHVVSWGGSETLTEIGIKELVKKNAIKL